MKPGKRHCESQSQSCAQKPESPTVAVALMGRLQTESGGAVELGS